LGETTTLDVQFQPEHEFVFDYLTSDIKTADCIFDLIDNSIDAATATNVSMVDNSDSRFFEGFKIDLSLSPNCVKVQDNCGGISKDAFVNRAFRIGLKSNHSYGIGHFGVGLKRAILKIGASYKIASDDGKDAMRLAFSRSDLVGSGSYSIPATRTTSAGATTTDILITDIEAEAKRDLESNRWLTVLIDDIGRRYGIFIKKGLSIAVNANVVTAFAPRPVESEFVPLQKVQFKSNGVDVKIVAGMHEQYRFARTAKGVIGADPSNLLVHKKIAKEYGWYIICNDRVIVAHDQSYKTGWTTNWHNEYSGFVGWVEFSSEDPSLLPWNTRKSDIIENSDLYFEVLPKLQQIAKQFRKITPLTTGRRKTLDSSKLNQDLFESLSEDKKAEKLKSSNTQKLNADPKIVNSNGAVHATLPSPATDRTVLNGTSNKAALASISTLLPSNVGFASTKPRLAGLVFESERLLINDFPYACAILLRVLYEATVRDFLIRHNHYVSMRDQVFESKLREGEVLDEAKRNNYAPPLNDMIAWCINNPNIFPAAEQRSCRLSCEKFKTHLPALNGIVHEPGGVVSDTQVRIIRDSILHGLLCILAT
jgi:hypothetical protein